MKKKSNSSSVFKLQISLDWRDSNSHTKSTSKQSLFGNNSPSHSPTLFSASASSVIWTPLRKMSGDSITKTHSLIKKPNACKHWCEERALDILHTPPGERVSRFSSRHLSWWPKLNVLHWGSYLRVSNFQFLHEDRNQSLSTLAMATAGLVAVAARGVSLLPLLCVAPFDALYFFGALWSIEKSLVVSFWSRMRRGILHKNWPVCLTVDSEMKSSWKVKKMKAIVSTKERENATWDFLVSVSCAP